MHKETVLQFFILTHSTNSRYLADKNLYLIKLYSHFRIGKMKPLLQKQQQRI